MLGGIRNKLQNVQQEISASLKNLRVTDSKKSVGHDGSRKNSELCWSSDAGGEILSKYQESWSQIHKATESNAKKAEEVDKLIEDMFEHLENEKKKLKTLDAEVQLLPRVCDEINDISRCIGNLHGVCEEVESNLVFLEDVIERLQLHDLQLNHRLQFASYREKKRADMYILKSQLAKEYEKKMNVYRQKEKKTQQERSQTFGQVFDEQMRRYRKLGTLEDTSSSVAVVGASETAVGEEASALDNIQIETDTMSSDLDKFLDDSEELAAQSSESQFENSTLAMQTSGSEKEHNEEETAEKEES